MNRIHFCIATAVAVASPAMAAPDGPAILAADLPVVVITGTAEHPERTADSDISTLLSKMPGYSVAQGGGVSGLPVVNGLADDRIKIRVDGMELTSACANHMNPPLSYIDPGQVGQIDLVAGVTPVSAGGDSIGGTITVTSAAPFFARAGEGWRTRIKLGASAKSVNDGVNASVSASAADDSTSIGYTAAYARGHSYEDGNGERVLGSMFESINQAVTLALRGSAGQLTLRAGVQHIPYQGFPNQYMDMTDNTARHANLAYAGRFGWGDFDASVYWQKTEHDMGFFTPERTGMMPMTTRGSNAGYVVKAAIPLASGTLRIGNEFHRFRLDDFWPAVPGSMMMGPNTYVNVNDGMRDRAAVFGEVETRHDARWLSLLGARWEWVRMDAGAVQAYGTGMMNAADAAAARAFNARERRRDDGNLDLTALARFTPSEGATYEFALARKTRSPNLYERYSWGRGTMAMTMTNWFGDGNGYVGDIDLKREAAATLAVTADWHGGGEKGWFVRVNPYFSKVADYIDVDVLGTFNPYMKMSTRGTLLRFANHDAKLYGTNLSWRLPLLAQGAYGSIALTGNAAWSRGTRRDGGDLYRIMPLNALLALEHELGRWSSQLDVRAVARKDHVDLRRLEPVTAGYALVGLRTAFQAQKHVRLTAGVSNLFDKAYADPLGGVYLSGLKAQGGALRPLPGYGRAFELGMNVEF
ncbi:TonB-dependent receptor [Pseudoduganella armeniaca]|uniref:TonB-dependent receptor n=1 Tax=Pseudoduganella armeniaca TaxID=2072590 RepID=A0A2R4C6F7_9BURK|nr:TonB-dependent receptor [Pseudoduganella armeniaca]AVR95140.1 TonB-dependent receptor [Pseudoduganella armeniaca]